MKAVLLSALAAGFAVGCGIQAFVMPVPDLVWNVTASAPIGLYRRSSGPIVVGAWVLVRAPEWASIMASQRLYIPRNVPLVKRIAASGGARVCRDNLSIRINGNLAAKALTRDAKGRPLPRWEGCRTLARGQAFLLTAPPNSFDSRYFGVVQGANVIERIVPLWTF